MPTKRFERIRGKLKELKDEEDKSDIEFLLDVISIYHGAMVTRDPEKVLEAIVQVKELDSL